MLQTDYHLHTTFSFDAEQTPEALCARAVELNLTHIALTEHTECGIMEDGQPEWITDPAAYIEKVEELREQFPGLTIRRGAEIGWRDRDWYLAAQHIKEIQPEFVIGSVHDIHGIDPYYPKYYAGLSRKQAYKKYLLAILEALPALLPISDTIGHIDYVAKFAPYERPTLEYKEFPEILDAILQAVIHAGKRIELNTSTCRRGQEQYRPNLSLLKRYKELGGKEVTVGSDAHTTRDVAAYFSTAEEILGIVGLRVAIL